MSHFLEIKVQAGLIDVKPVADCRQAVTGITLKKQAQYRLKSYRKFRGADTDTSDTK